MADAQSTASVNLELAARIVAAYVGAIRCVPSRSPS